MRLSRAVLPILLLLAAAALAGCADSPPSPSASAHPDGPDRLGRGRGTEAGDVVYDTPTALDAAAATTGPVTELHGITALHWATGEALPGLALELSLDLGKSNDCAVKTGALVHPDHPSLHDLMLAEGDGWSAWGSGGGGALASAHAGAVDTRDLLGEDGLGGSAGRFSGPLSGPVRLTLAAPRLEAWDDHGFLLADGMAAAVSVTCDQPFDVLATRGGTQVALGGPSTWGGGAGADVFLAGSANVADGMGLSSASPAVRAAAGGFGEQAEQLTLTHPQGEEDWIFLPEQGPLYTYEGGAGDYTVQSTGANAGALWAGLWGLDGPFDLRPGLRGDSAIKVF